MPRLLCVVSRDYPELYEYLRREFAGKDEVIVTLDRRRGERRQRRDAVEGDRRCGHRRWHPDNRETLSAVGAFMIPLERE